MARRREAPVGFLDELRSVAHARGFGVVGFKLMYNHALSHPELLDALTADASLRIIHVTRRNLLQRLVSERQARATKRWAVGRGDETPTMPKVEIDMADLVASLARTESRQAMFQEKFARHETLNVIYEDIATKPGAPGRPGGGVPGASPLQRSPVVKLRKMGAQSLGDALIGADALRAQMRRWGGVLRRLRLTRPRTSSDSAA